MKNTIKILILFLIFGLKCSSAFSQRTTLSWATYFGGDSAGGIGLGRIAKDTFGNIYITGTTYSDTGIATKGAYQTVGDSVSGDVFLAKFSPSGSLIWGTYYGGSEFDAADGLSIDKLGNIYITGTTYSDTGIATKGAYQTVGDSVSGDVFLAKFSPSGSLIWGTYYGGSGYENDYFGGVINDQTGNVYITGTTYSDTGIATKGAYQTVGDNINGDVFLAKFSPSGSMIWGTYYGGNQIEQGYGIAIKNTNIYITGYTYSDSNIATVGAYQAYSPGGAFLANFSTSGTLMWATYYGTNNNGWDLKTDPFNNIYVVGEVNDYATEIATLGAYQSSYGGGFSDGFLAQFSSTGHLNWGTYFGGNGDDAFYSLILDSSNNIYISGETSSILSIATSGAYQSSYGGGPADALLAKFSSAGNLFWSTYYGGSGDDGGGDIVNDEFGNLYVTGNTSSTSGIATLMGYHTTLAGYTSFLAKFQNHVYKNDAGIYRILNPSNNSCIGSEPVTVQLLNYGSDTLKSAKINWSINSIAQTTYNWTGSLNPGSTATINLGNYNFKAGAYTITASTSLPNGVKDSFPYNDAVSVTDTILASRKANTGGNKMVCAGSSILIGSYNTDTTIIYTWKSKPSGFVSSSDTATVTPISTTTYYLKIISPCGSDSDSAVIMVNSLPVKNGGKDTSICFGSSINIGSKSLNGYKYSWVSTPSGFTSTLSNPMVSPTISTSYTLTETIAATGCKQLDTVIITVNPLPDALFSEKEINDTDIFIPKKTTYISYSWSFGDSFSGKSSSDSSNLISPKHFYLKDGRYIISLSVTDKNGCTATSKTTDTVIHTDLLNTQKPETNLRVYPNPFTDKTVIAYFLRSNSAVNTAIYDMTGREVIQLYDGIQTEGRHEIEFDLNNNSAGIYVLKMQISNEVITAKIMKIN